MKKAITVLASKNQIISRIIKIEGEWFSSLNTKDSHCQENKEAFTKMRRVNFSTWSKKTLIKYYYHILVAKSEGRNLMAEKYLVMNGELTLPDPTPLIFNIVEIELNWIKQLREKYPGLLKNDLDYFKRYLTSELKTYSIDVIESYYDDLKKALSKNINLAEERYKEMARLLGFPSISAMLNSKKIS